MKFKSISKLIATTFITLGISSFSYTDNNAATYNTRTPITVGYYEIPGFFQNTIKNGKEDYTGYANELINIVLSSNNYDIAFKRIISYKDVSEHKDFDLFFGLPNIPDYSNLLFSNMPMFQGSYNLYTKQDNSTYAIGDFKNYNGINIGVLSYENNISSLKNFASEKNFTYVENKFTNYNELTSALNNGIIDAIYLSSLYKIYKIKTLATTEFTPYFFATNDSKKKNIIDEIDSTLFKLYDYSPSYFSDLQDKYYQTNESDATVVFTKEETLFLDEYKKKTLNVLVDPNWAPFEYIDSNNQYSGIMRAVFDKISTNYGLNFKYFFDDSYKNTVALYKDKVDIFSCIANDYEFALENDYKITTPIFNSGIRIVKSDNSNPQFDNYGITAGTSIARYFDLFLPEYKYIQYPTIDALYDGLVNGEVNQILVLTLSSFYFQQKFKNITFTINDFAINRGNHFSFGIKNNTPVELYSIFDKIAASINFKIINEYYEDEIDKLPPFNLIDYILNNDSLKIIVAFVLGILIFSFALIILSIKTSSNSQIKILNNYDKNTGLYNKDTFCTYCHNLLISNSKKKYIFCLLKINRFQVLNEVFGSDEGNIYLKKVADYFKVRYKGRRDLVYGAIESDIFGLMLEYSPTTMDEIAFLSREISQKFFNNQNSFFIGFYIIENNYESVYDFIDYAYLATEKAHNQRNYHGNFAFYDENMISKIQESNFYSEDISRALTEDEIKIYFQPQVRISDNEIVSAEALVRWVHPIKGYIPNGKFISVLESSGKIFELDKYVWRKSIEFLANHKEYKNLKISLNISKADLFYSETPRIIDDLLREFSVESNKVSFEITESAYVENPNLLNIFITEMHLLGIKVGMDDFGSEYSSLNMLKNFNLDYLKIDMNFLKPSQNMLDDESASSEERRSEIIIQSVINMANALNIPSIFEGVEKTSEYQLVKDAKATIIQGYYFSKPIEESSFLELLKIGKIEGKDYHE